MHASSAYLNGAGGTRGSGTTNVDDLDMLNTLLTGAATESPRTASRPGPSNRNEVRERHLRKARKDVNR